MSLPLPDNEEERLKTLYSYKILDTLAEENYDNITKLAAEIFEMPISTISLIDRDRQWFKSEFGQNIKQTTREDAFCTHTIMTDQVMIIEDVTRDDRFKNNPMVIDDPEIKFYAGAPIVMDNNIILGAVCVIDRIPRQLTEKEIRILETLAAQAANLMKMKKISMELRDKKEKIKQLELIIPMCAWCKNIKDDYDYWTKVEDYISSVSSRNISHAICPDCNNRLTDPHRDDHPEKDLLSP